MGEPVEFTLEIHVAPPTGSDQAARQVLDQAVVMAGMPAARSVGPLARIPMAGGTELVRGQYEVNLPPLRVQAKLQALADRADILTPPEGPSQTREQWVLATITGQADKLAAVARLADALSGSVYAHARETADELRAILETG